MRAAILVAQNAPLLVAEVQVPRLDVGQVLVDVECAGVCGKQIDEITGRRGEDPFIPHLLGHEGVGVVAAVGPGVRKVRPGDRVVLHWMKGSGIDSAPPRFSRDGQTISAGWVTTFSERTVASENRVTPIPSDVRAEIATLLGCAVTTGLGIVFNDADLRVGQSVAVFGVGGVGLNVVQGAALVNAHPIVAIDLFDEKLERAKAFGATDLINARRTSVAEALRDLSGGRGFDASVDTTGEPDVIQSAYAATASSGTTVLAGVPDHRTRIEIDPFPLHLGRRLVGSHGGGTRPDIDIPRCLALYRLGRLKLDELVTHRFPLEQVNEAIEVVRRGAAARCLLSMR